MKILYISPENTVGTLTLWKKEHISRGNECRTITFFHSPKNFEEDICLDLPFNFTNPITSKIRNALYRSYRGGDGYYKEKEGYPPYWKPDGQFDYYLIFFYLVSSISGIGFAPTNSVNDFAIFFLCSTKKCIS